MKFINHRNLILNILELISNNSKLNIKYSIKSVGRNLLRASAQREVHQYTICYTCDMRVECSNICM